MIRCWTALGIRRATERFRRIKGHRDLDKLAQALRGSDLSAKVA